MPFCSPQWPLCSLFQNDIMAERLHQIRMPLQVLHSFTLCVWAIGSLKIFYLPWDMQLRWARTSWKTYISNRYCIFNSMCKYLCPNTQKKFGSPKTLLLGVGRREIINTCLCYLSFVKPILWIWPKKDSCTWLL